MDFFFYLLRTLHTFFQKIFSAFQTLITYTFYPYDNQEINTFILIGKQIQIGITHHSDNKEYVARIIRTFQYSIRINVLTQISIRFVIFIR